MRSNVQQRPMTYAEETGLGPKKTLLVIVTVVGCIAILFPKIFYPMMVGPTALKQDPNRLPPNLQKQERPPHFKDIIHPGMQERGRAIPPHPTVPIVERPGRPGGPPPNIERRPGSPLVPGQPGPNLRAASFQAQHQQQQKAASSSIIMPLYTFGIVAFFVFTIAKILLKKTKPDDKGMNMQSDPNFVEKVFKQGATQEPKKKLGWKDHNAIYTAIQGIIDATNNQLSEIERNCAEKNVEHISTNNTAHKTGDDEREHENNDENTQADIKLNENEESTETTEENEEDKEVTKDESSKDLLNVNGVDSESKNESNDIKSEHDIEVEKRLNHLKEAMHIRSVENIENSDLKSIFLEGELPHDPKILVSATETETKTERMSQYPSVKDVAEDETVILSGKMTISLISLANDDEKNGIVEDHTTTNNVA
ncbi:resistance to inhibitors of cholinesterase protein 3 isoform X2 [Chironomus tepperi]|uniref:resistance to inhibitors of cholinesterase protein 3 isoform X2 n=1 Tax=Chironomus tepperi TaxID=113505 RepID=UPI00391F3E45